MPASKIDALEVVDDSAAQLPAGRVFDAPVSTFAVQTNAAPVDVQTAAVTLQAPAASLAPTPTAPDGVSIVFGYVSTFVNVILGPFASAGEIPPPADPPTLWTLLAWVRREILNESPTVSYNPVQNTQGQTVDGDVVITGNIGAVDPDGDPLTYSVIGRPLNGGTVLSVDEDGNFTYRPTMAMAAVGGTDQFTVVVSDAAAGLHLHGPLGLIQFAPIVGNFVAPGGAHAVAQTITVTVTAVDGLDLSFPENFHRGVATAGFQSEMARAHRWT